LTRVTKQERARCPCLTSAWYSNFSSAASSPAGFSATAASHLTTTVLAPRLSAAHLTPVADLADPLSLGVTGVAAEGALLPAHGRSAATDDAPRAPLSTGAMGNRGRVGRENGRHFGVWRGRRIRGVTGTRRGSGRGWRKEMEMR
jgi:hypothetical protein